MVVAVYSLAENKATNIPKIRNTIVTNKINFRPAHTL